MNERLQILLREAPVLLDGAWGTQLQARGLPTGACPDAWNVTRPGDVEAVARAYVEAGSRVILTNTFGASRYMLERHDLAEDAYRINRTGAEISVRAAEGRAFVFGSMGPSGKMLMMGDVPAAELEEVFREQARALAEGGADGLVVETMSDIDECRCAIRAARSTGLPVAACMVFDSGAEKDRTMMGITPEMFTAAASDEGADIIGSNCGRGIESFLPICRRLKACTDAPIWIKANAGLPETRGGRTAYAMQAETFADHVPPLIEAGAVFVGGCCGTGPDFIRAVKQRLNA